MPASSPTKRANGMSGAVEQCTPLTRTLVTTAQ